MDSAGPAAIGRRLARRLPRSYVVRAAADGSRIMRARGGEAPSQALDSHRWTAQALERLAPARIVRGLRLPRLPLPLIDRQLRTPTFMLPARWHLGEPIVLDKSMVDDWIPFLEWTIWIYVSYYLFLILAPIMGRFRPCCRAQSMAMS
jgi:hypothetical protein